MAMTGIVQRGTKQPIAAIGSIERPALSGGLTVTAIPLLAIVIWSLAARRGLRRLTKPEPWAMRRSPAPG